MQLMNTPIPPIATPTARRTLPQSNLMNGNGAMNPPNAGMNQAEDGGAMSKLWVNAQPSENQALAMQELTQNAQTQAPQYVAATRGAFTKEMTEGQTAAYRAQTNLANQMTELIASRGGGENLIKLNAALQSPDKASLVNSIETQRAMAANMDPALGALYASEQQYTA